MTRPAALLAALVLAAALPAGAKTIRMAKDGSGDAKNAVELAKLASVGDEVVNADKGLLGLQLKREDKTKPVLVASIMPGSAATDAGVKAGDVVLAIDGDDLSGLELAKVVEKARGTPGSKAKLKLQAADGQTRVVEVERRAIPFKIQADVQLLEWAAASDPDSAIELAKQFVAQGRSGGEAYLSDAYQRGVGVKRDLKEAARWAKQGADKGDMLCTRMYGFILFNRWPGVEHNPIKGAELLKKAAAAGDGSAAYGLSQAYEKGEGVPKNEDKAQEYLEQAAAKGVPEAVRRVGKK